MDGRQIKHIISWHVYQFHSIYNSDNLPQRHGPKLLIANTNLTHCPGEQWIDISVDGQGNGQYFNSFGRPPSKTIKCYFYNADIVEVGCIIESSFKVLLANYVDNTVLFGACLTVEK